MDRAVEVNLGTGLDVRVVVGVGERGALAFVAALSAVMDGGRDVVLALVRHRRLVAVAGAVG